MQNLFTVNQLVEAEPALCKASIRLLLLRRGPDLEALGIVLRLGKKIIFDRDKLLAWMATPDSRKKSSDQRAEQA